MRKTIVLFILIFLLTVPAISVLAEDYAVKVGDEILTEKELGNRFERMKAIPESKRKSDDIGKHTIISNYIRYILVKKQIEAVGLNFNEAQSDAKDQINEAAEGQNKTLTEYAKRKVRTYDQLVEDVTTTYAIDDLKIHYKKKAQEIITEEQIDAFLNETEFKAKYEGNQLFGEMKVKDSIFNALISLKRDILFRKEMTEVFRKTEINISENYPKEKIFNTLQF